MITISASEKQKELLFKIFELGGVNRYDDRIQKILNDRKLASSYIDNYLGNLTATKEKYTINILKNINFEWFLNCLGYTQTDKSSINSKQYRLGKDIVNLRVDNSANTKLKTDAFSYLIFFPLEDRKHLQAPQLNLDMPQQKNARCFSEQKGGNIINFVKDRALLYSEEQILFMLNKIADDNNTIKNFLKGVENLDNIYDNYKAVKIQDKESKNKDCLKKFQKLKSLEESNTDFVFRGIDMNIYSQSMNSKQKIFIVPERIDNSTKNEKDFSTIFFRKNKDSIIKSIVCPIMNINEQGMLSIVGFQKNPIINPKIFDIAKEIKREKYTDIMNYIIEEDENKVCSDEDVIQVFEKITKQTFPQEIKKDPLLMSIITAMLKIKSYDGYDKDNNITKWKTELINSTKKKGSGSLGGIAIAKAPKDFTKEQAIAVFENPVFDGFSALKLNYFKDYDITLVGTLGTVTLEFLNELKKMFFSNHPYTKIFLMLDNDEAGKRNKEKIEDAIFQEAKNRLLEIVNFDSSKILNLQNIKEVCNIIISQKLAQVSHEKIINKLNAIEIIEITPKNFKDFNEELLNTFKENKIDIDKGQIKL